VLKTLQPSHARERETFLQPIRVCDEAGNLIETQEQKGDFKEP
jgi:hypothetical protein